MGTRSRAELPGASSHRQKGWHSPSHVWLMSISELKVEGFLLGPNSESLEHLEKHRQTDRQRLYYRQKQKQA